MGDSLKNIKKELFSLGSRKKAELLQKFFKTGKGQYGEGDVFIGVMVPQVRNIVKKYKDIEISETIKLLHSKEHELRLAALLILVEKYNKSDEGMKRKIFNAYLGNTKYINNWDLIDLTAPRIIGKYLYSKDRGILKKLAKSKSLWERRISLLATFHFIDNGEFKDSLKLAKLLLDDKEDLIHKAIGWMLREIWKRDPRITESFIRKYIRKMPRTSLRYAIERMPEKRRKEFLKL